MNILLVNQNWFAKELRELGHKVYSFGRNPGLDISQPRLLVSWAELKALLPKDFEPELLIVHDDSSSVLITEMETIDIPSAFYSVDVHHHLSFHRYLGLVFSHIFIAQSDYIPEFQKLSITPHWLPLWASVYMEPQQVKKYGAVFLGTLNSGLNPERVRFFEELKKLVEIDVRTAPFTDIFPASQIVMNQTVKGDLNFRVFEAMMSGALLITERAGNGLDLLFKDKEHLVLYQKGDVNDAAQKISYYLGNPSEAQKIGKAGRDLICQQHLPIHRAQFLIECLSKPTRPNPKPSAYAAIRNFANLSSVLQGQAADMWRNRSMLEALRLADVGLRSSELLDPMVALDIVYALLNLEAVLGEARFTEILETFRQAYPKMAIFHLARINQLVVAGKQSIAEAVAFGMSDLPIADVLLKADEVVRELRR